MKFKSGKSRKIRDELALGKKTLKNRLWLLQISLVIAIITGIIIVLILTGTFEVLNGQSFVALNSELEHTSANITRRFFTISQNTYDFADKINKSINNNLEKKGLTVSDLKKHPEILETILDRQVDISIFAMQKSNCSGVFVILDSTVNPKLLDAQFSKSGFYIKDIEPYPVPYSTNVLMLLRGSPEIARNYDMYLDTEWQLEVDTDVSKVDVNPLFYIKPFNAALNSEDKDIRKLGYWCPPFKMDINCKKAMTFSVPLIDKNGIVYGVCGLELSERFFNAYMPPVPQDYNRLFYLVGIKDDDSISVSKSIHLGDYSVRFISSQPNFLTSSFDNSKKYKFRKYYFDSNNKNPVVGLETNINIYNSQSVFKEAPWVLTALLPPNDVAKTKAVFLFIGLILLFLSGISIAYYISKSYTKPISQVFKQIIEKADNVDKTNIIEIDDLIEFLKQEQKRVEEKTGFDISDAQYDEFSKQLASLTKTEREIFDLYIEGYSAKQICEKKYLSINTVKTHNRRIYAKLNVSSRAELLSYCYRLMREYSGDSTNKL